MKNLKIKMTVLCDKCGKLAPVDKKHSNENWISYDTSKSCECGGKFIAKHETIKD